MNLFYGYKFGLDYHGILWDGMMDHDVLYEVDGKELVYECEEEVELNMVVVLSK